MCLVGPADDRVEQAPLELEVAALLGVGVGARQRAAQFSLHQLARRLQRRLSVFIVGGQIGRRRRLLRLRRLLGRLEQLGRGGVDVAAGSA